MEITNIRIWLVNEDKLKAYVSIIIDNAFMIRDIKLIKTEKGLFIAMPNKKLKDGSFMDLAHPISAECRIQIEEAILRAYEEKLETFYDRSPDEQD